MSAQHSPSPESSSVTPERLIPAATLDSFRDAVETSGARAPEVSSSMDIARALARRGWHVLPCCWPDEAGACGCPGTKDGPHRGRDVGKAPIGRLVPRGCHDASAEQRRIWSWWAAFPLANVAVDLARSGLVFVDPDSPEALAEAIALGLPPTVIRISRNPGYLYRRPADCPIATVTHRGASGKLDVLAKGYAVVAGRHATGCDVYLEELGELPAAPAWAIEMLRTSVSERVVTDGETGSGQPPVRLDPRGLERWRGELVERQTDGTLDRSRSLWHLGLELAAANASAPAIAAALAERDTSLGWDKYVGRGDATERYAEMAKEAVGWAERIAGGPTGWRRRRHVAAEIVVRVAS